jgi:hypothetical protein
LFEKLHDMTVFMQYIFTNIEKINKNKPERKALGRGK